MPVNNYKIYINRVTRIVIYFLSDRRNILDFVVKIEYFFHDSWREVERYDCAHGYVHKDMLDRRGRKKRVIAFNHLDLKSGLNYAISDFKKNHESIIRRYLHEKERQGN